MPRASDVERDLRNGEIEVKCVSPHPLSLSLPLSLDVETDYSRSDADDEL